MKVARIDGEAAWTELAPQWQALADRSPSAHLFNDHDWLAAWWRAFADPQDALRIYTVESGGRLVGALPLKLSPGRRLGSLFNHYLGRTDLLLEGGKSEAVRGLLEGLVHDAADWDVAQLDQMPEDSAAYADVCRVAPGAKLRVHGVRNLASPYLDLQGEYAQWYSARFSGRKRQQDRRRLRQFEQRQGEVAMLTEPEAVTACFEEALQVEALGWKGDENSAMKSQPETAAFMREVVRRFSERGLVRLVSLRMEGALAAFLLGFVRGGTLYFHKTGFDPRFDAQSPGRLALLTSIEAAYNEGLARYDFLGAPDPYKLQCSPTVRPHTTLFLYHHGLRSRLLRQVKRGAIPLAKRLGRGGEALPVSVDR